MVEIRILVFDKKNRLHFHFTKLRYPMKLSYLEYLRHKWIVRLPIRVSGLLYNLGREKREKRMNISVNT